jgi:hypothetical protein
MKLRKLIKLVFGLLTGFAVAVGLTSVNHPIILKWVTGSAKHHGKPMAATVYTNGQINSRVKVFYTDEENSYLVSLADYDNSGMLTFINITLNDKWLGRPVATSKTDYDLIAGHLFQSEAGGHFSPFQDPVKGFNFEPQLSAADGQIRFNLPPNKVEMDSVRILLP